MDDLLSVVLFVMKINFKVAQMVWLGTPIMEVSSSKPLLVTTGDQFSGSSLFHRACLVQFTSPMSFASYCTRARFTLCLWVPLSTKKVINNLPHVFLLLFFRLSLVAQCFCILKL